MSWKQRVKEQQSGTCNLDEVTENLVLLGRKWETSDVVAIRSGQCRMIVSGGRVSFSSDENLALCFLNAVELCPCLVIILVLVVLSPDLLAASLENGR